MKKHLCFILLLMLTFSGAFCIAHEESYPVLSDIVEEDNSEWESILLIGADTRQDLLEEGRADAIIIASINRESGAIRLASLARDMWIDLPGDRGHNRINTAFRFGGSELMMQAVNEVTGLNIEHYLSINFYGFCDVIDALGGVEIELTRAEAGFINRTVKEEYGDQSDFDALSEGKATLNGVQALAFARIRKLDNDHGRTKRQRDILVGVLNKINQYSFVEQLTFIDRCFKCVNTNLKPNEIAELGIQIIANGLEDIQQLGLPSKGNFKYKTQNGMSTIVFNTSVLRQELHAFIYGE